MDWPLAHDRRAHRQPGAPHDRRSGGGHHRSRGSQFDDWRGRHREGRSDREDDQHQRIGNRESHRVGARRAAADGVGRRRHQDAAADDGRRRVRAGEGRFARRPLAISVQSVAVRSAMRRRHRFGVASTVLVATLVAAGAVTVLGQAARKPASANLPRMADGHPDLQGTYDLGTLTPLERTAESPLVLTDEAAKKLEAQVAKQRDQLAAPIAGNRSAPPSGGDGSPGPYGNVGGYNNFWLDPGSHYTVIDGQKRGSLIIDPPDGRVPPMKASARERNARRAVTFTSDQRVNEEDPGFEGPEAYNDPEQRPLGERCIVGFGSTSGPPILPTYFYNNLHQIVQTPSQILILTEMVHDARVIRMNATHLAPTIRKWLGDSIGRWEGDTLVVDTTNFTDKTRFRGSSDQLHIVERFTRADARTLRYPFTVED